MYFLLCAYEQYYTLMLYRYLPFCCNLYNPARVFSWVEPTEFMSADHLEKLVSGPRIEQRCAVLI